MNTSLHNQIDIANLKANPDWASLPIFDRSGWKTLPFGAFAENVNERVEPSDAADEIYVGLEHLDPQDLHVRRWGRGSDVIGTKLRFRKGDIIFGRRRAYQRKLAVAEFDGICSAHAMVVRAKPDIVLPEFLPFLMMSDRFMNRAVEISVGSLSPTINWTALKLEEFALPPLDQQRRIAEILRAVEDVVTRISVAEGAADAVVVAELDDFLFCRQDWPRHECRKVLAEGPRNGYSPPISQNGGQIPTLSIGAVRDGRVITEGNVKYANASTKDVERFRLSKGDILVVRGNGNRQLCGCAGIVDSFPDGCFYPDLLILLRFDPMRLLPEFAVMQWNEPKTHARLLRKAKSTNGIWKVNGQDIQSHQLIVPPVSEQREFLDMLRSRMVVRQRFADEEALTMHLLRSLTNALVG